ncbi:MAG TPA: hypothetical protein VGS07_24015 [Thermoanaerobaculia bacterium]|nr:hypothetical protein [Thermoanaerobaculia bacterium]
MSKRRKAGAFAVLLTGTLLAAAAPAAAQLQWSSKDGSQSFKVGLLGQMQAEEADVAGSDDTSKNLSFRRLRLIMGFNLSDKLSIFVDTDSPNLGKATAGVKDTGNIFIQDFAATYKFAQAFQLDGGLLLMEQDYNHNQSAASLMTLDYGAYTFNESTPTTSRTGRDYGLRARGYVADDHLEYRLGIYQGVRGTNNSNEFRYAGRLMYTFFTPQVGLFYRGTSLGKTHSLSIGGSFDKQEEYHNYAGDFYLDQPLGGGNSLVLQGDYNQIDGGKFLTTLPKQDDVLIEAGVYFASVKLQPFIQYASEDFKDPLRIDETRDTFGIAYFLAGHNDNVKLSYTRIEPKHGDSRKQINLQWQVFQF